MCWDIIFSCKENSASSILVGYTCSELTRSYRRGQDEKENLNTRRYFNVGIS